MTRNKKDQIEERLMKRFFIAGNWKMNKTIREAKAFADEFKTMMPAKTDEIAIIAPFTQIAALKEAFVDTEVKIGAQNVHFEPSGAFTGEISVDMLTELGVDCCIVGHSERREYFAETDETVNKKLKALYDASIMPILCVGENLATRETGGEKDFVEKQIRVDFDGISAEDAAKTVIAYEPIWAIGTGRTATDEQAEEMCRAIREMIGELYDEYVAKDMIIQYGGSVKPQNAKAILAMPDINGALVGGASLDPEKFTAIVVAAHA